MSNEKYMERALELARLGEGSTRPNPMVGSVIVKDGQVIGEGFHSRAGKPHAEREALLDAEIRGENVAGATIYVTLEPCNHTGRTGPCTDAIIEAGLSRVVVASQDPNPKATGGLDKLRAAGIEVTTGIMEQEARLLNSAFLTYHSLKRPLVTLKWAMTLDGCTSVSNGDSKWITGKEAREEVHRTRALHDAILAGVETVIRDDARLTARVKATPPGPPLKRIVLDSTLRLPLEAAFLEDHETSPALICCSEKADPRKREMLEQLGATIVPLPLVQNRIDLKALMEFLYRQGVQSLFVEGGRTVAGAFLQAGLVDRVDCYIAPKLSGGGSIHLGPVRISESLGSMDEATAIHHSEPIETFGNDLRVRGWVTRHLFDGA